MQAQVTKQDFATQVRSERLDLIWKATALVAAVGLWIAILFEFSTAENIIFPILVIAASSFVCRYFLRHGQLNAATWSYAIGSLLAIGLVITVDDEFAREALPFTSLIVLYIVGLLLPARATVPLVLYTVTIILVAPWIGDGEVTAPSAANALAMFLAVLTGLISAQASGELYSIAEWALENYRRERDGANRLYESQEKVKKSLLRQTALAEELQATNVDLAEARRAAETAKQFRGQFLANMSHELRTPLNAVIGFSDTMLNFPLMYDDVELPEEYRKDLNQINNSGKHLLNIINDILDLSKIDAGRLDINIQTVDLEPIFRGTMSTAVGLVGGKPVKLTRNTPPPEELPQVMGDPVRIRQVLLNLYSNAAKFTESGNITLTMQQDEKEVTICLADTGEGIPPENLELIFEEFRQSEAGKKKARAGAGLGLAISRQLLSLMNGRIWVESVQGEGSTFYFTLPIAQATAAEKTLEGQQSA